MPEGLYHIKDSEDPRWLEHREVAESDPLFSRDGDEVPHAPAGLGELVETAEPEDKAA
jgi:hypothetical protein